MEDLNAKQVDSSKDFLDLSDGTEDWAEVACEVPEETSPDSQYHNYTVRVNKEDIVGALNQDTFKDFWAKVEKSVLDDISK